MSVNKDPVRLTLVKSALFFRRCVQADRADNEPMFERMSLDSYRRARKRVIAYRKAK